MNNIQANPVGIIKKDIYIIKNDINNKVYIGQSLNAEKRFKSHCKPNQDNSLIDTAIQKYGKQHFWFEIIESQIENYNEREKYWIYYYDSITPNGYNILSGGNEPPVYYGEDHPNSHISNADVELLKKDLANTTISLSQLAKKYNISKKSVANINQGITHSKVGETYPVRENPNINGKLTEEQVDEIIYLLKYTYRFNGEIAHQYGVDVHAILRINQGVTHKRDNIEYPIRKWKSCGVFPVTYEQVTDIIDELILTDHSMNSIAKKYGISPSVIKGICSGTSKKYKRDNLQYPLRSF